MYHIIYYNILQFDAWYNFHLINTYKYTIDLNPWESSVFHGTKFSNKETCKNWP